MSEKLNNDKLYLKHIAKRTGSKNIKDLLYELIPYKYLYAPVQNVEFMNKKTGFTFLDPASDLPVPESILNIIYSKNFWKGDVIRLDDHTTEARFKCEITISIDDLYLYEKDFKSIEGQINNTVETGISEAEHQNLYKLIWILKDMLVDDGKEKSYTFTEVVPKICTVC